jgi:hypothetical protein
MVIDHTLTRLVVVVVVVMEYKQRNGAQHAHVVSQSVHSLISSIIKS